MHYAVYRLFLMCLIYTIFVELAAGQVIEDSVVLRHDPQPQIDLLNQELDSLKSEFEESKKNMVTVSDLNMMFKSINEDDVEFTSDDRRSKRRVLDSLFRSALLGPDKLTFTGQFMGVFHWDGKLKNSINTVVGTVDLFAIATLGQRNLIFINLQGAGGNGPSQYFESFNGFHAGAGTTQASDGLDRINILEAWVEFSLGSIRFTAGKIDLTNYFDPNSIANDEYTQFLSNGFVNNTSLAVPNNAPGVVINSRLLKGITLRFAVSSNDNSGDRIFEKLFTIAQLGKSIRIKNVQLGGIRMYGYYNSEIENGWGYGVSADIRLFGNVNAFGRYGYNLDSLGLNFGVDKAYSAGLQARNYRIFKKILLTSGIAFSESATSKPDSDREVEMALEAYIRFSIRKKYYISPVYQHIKNGAGLKNNDLSVFGLRTRIVF